MDKKARKATDRKTRTVIAKPAKKKMQAQESAGSRPRTALMESGVPPIVVPNAALEIGIHIPDSAPYFGENGGPDRADFEAKVWAELVAKVASPVWDLWKSVELAQSHPTEAQVRDAIAGALNANNTHPQKKTSFFLTNAGSGATPTSVRYVWRDGKFVRVHSYALDEGTTGQNWVLIHEPPSGGDPVTVHLRAQLSWATDA